MISIDTPKLFVNSYEATIITNQNKVNLIITIKDSKLSFYCYFFKDYFKTSFKNDFSLDELKERCLFYNQFTNINEVYKELYYNERKGEEYIEGNEELDNKIKINIPLIATKFPKLDFELNKIPKTENEILNEYNKVTSIYKNKIQIQNFSSHILAIFQEEKELLKSWISATKKLTANLLYSFYVKYNDKNEIDKEDINKIGNIEAFHTNCDDKNNILVICKSKKEIFGGYTPLPFNNKNEYGYDNKSFLFSINKKEKYPKNSYDNTESIWCYFNYGPCFHWDLYFRKYRMDAVKFENKNYFTPNNWVDKKECYVSDDGILLDSLEIYQIKIEDI